MNQTVLMPSEPLNRAENEIVRTFDEIRGKLFSSLCSLLGNRDDAQDALQAAFLRCWQAREQLPKLRNVRAWIWCVTLNVGRDMRDRVWRRRAKPLSTVE